MIKILMTSILLLLLSSCATGYKINMKHCQTDAKWSREGEFKIITHNISGVGVKEVSVTDILRDNKLNCGSLSEIKISISRTMTQSLLTIFPFYSAETIQVHFR